MADKPGRLVVVSGPSGVGKTTIVREVLKRTDCGFSISVTTRQPREDEVNGRDYHFVDRAAFLKMIDNSELLEWAEVFDQLYGTPLQPVRQAVADGKTMLLDIDVQGGMQVACKMPEATFVLIVPPNEEALAKRLCGRGTESAWALKHRLTKARHEVDAAKASGVYNYVVVNDDLETAVREVVGIVQQESRGK